MTKINLEQLSDAELSQLELDVQAEQKNRVAKNKSKALERIQTIAKEYGFSLAELTSKNAEKPKPKSRKPKYRHPDNADLTWGGMGRYPDWVRDEIAKGKTLQDLAISS
jgi:DNA-binding protein H-NS